MISNRDKKYIKSLQIKKYRQHHQAFLVEGWKSVSELLNSDFTIEYLFVSSKFKDLCNGIVVDEKEIKALSSLVNNNDAIAVAKIPENNDLIVPNQPIFIFDGIQDPGNLGTIVRTADWLGYKNVVCSTDSVDFYNSKVISATKGSFTRLQPIYVDEANFLSNHARKNIYMADLEGVNFKEMKYSNDDIFVFGGESQGIRKNVRNIAFKKISIPKRGGAESLNVAVAFGIIASFQ